MKYIKMFTGSEARRVLKSEWSIKFEEFDAFIVILYARGAYEIRKLDISYLLKIVKTVTSQVQILL